ncbi:MAG: hypothetical protein ABIP51_04245 [Bacteroidia bacterium]
MRTIKPFILTVTFSLMIIFLSFCNSDKDPTDPENAKLKQEILPKGKNENYGGNDTLTVGQSDSISKQ